MIRIVTGLPGSGKSCDTARIILELLHRNDRWYQKQQKIFEKQLEQRLKSLEATMGDVLDVNVSDIEPPKKRKIYSNLQVADHVIEAYPDFMQYWVDPAELVLLRDVDVVWDEVATHLDATQWANMSLELKRWLQQHRKFGVEIYGNTQDFAMIDISMRRLVSDLFWLTKIVGSADPSPTLPPVKNIWGIVVRRRLDPQTYSEDKKDAKGILDIGFMWIGKKLVSVFDTRQEVKMGKYPPLRHIERECERCALGTCTHKKVLHV